MHNIYLYDRVYICALGVGGGRETFLEGEVIGEAALGSTTFLGVRGRTFSSDESVSTNSLDG